MFKKNYPIYIIVIIIRYNYFPLTYFKINVNFITTGLIPTLVKC